MRNRYLAGFMMCVAIYSSNASASSDTFPTKITSVKTELSLIGEARFSVLFWDIYDSALFSKSGEFDSDKSFLFEITYLRDISSDELIKRTVEQWQHLDVPYEEYKAYLPLLADIWPDIASKDKLAIWVTGQGAAFYFNQQMIGSIPSRGFGEQFVAIWLSPNTSQPALREQLLGLDKVTQ